MLTNQQISLNLLDFSGWKEKDLYLCDVFSDANEFGGLSKTDLTVVHPEDKSDSFLRIKS